MKDDIEMQSQKRNDRSSASGRFCGNDFRVCLKGANGRIESALFTFKDRKNEYWKTVFGRPPGSELNRRLI